MKQQELIYCWRELDSPTTSENTFNKVEMHVLYNLRDIYSRETLANVHEET